MNKQFLRFTFFLLIYLTLPLTATAQVVDIPDTNLRTAVEKVLGKASGATITTADMAALRSSTARESNISDLTGLEHATNVTYLSLTSNSISDISPLAGLTNLSHLYLEGNSISDLSSLVATELEQISVRGNPLSYASIYTHIATLQSRGVIVNFKSGSER